MRPWWYHYANLRFLKITRYISLLSNLVFDKLSLISWIPVQCPCPCPHGSSRSCHYNDVMISEMASRITSLTIVYSGADQRKHQSSASLAFVRGIHRRTVNSPHKGPVTRKLLPFDDVIIISLSHRLLDGGHAGSKGMRYLIWLLILTDFYLWSPTSVCTSCTKRVVIW